MEPTSTATRSSATLLSVAVNASIFLRRLANGPALIHELVNRLVSFAAFVEAVTFSSLKNKTSFQELLRQAQPTVREVTGTLRRYDVAMRVESPFLSRIRWIVQDKKKMVELIDRLNHYQSNLELLSHVNNTPLQQPEDGIDMPEIVILVMGETGSGKSTFIQQITGSSNATVGCTLSSGTKTIKAYSAKIEGRAILLVDTPSIRDTSHGEEGVLQEVSSWLERSYQSRRLIFDIIYLYPITSDPMRGSAVKNSDLFASLIRFDPFHKIALVTTKWDLLKHPDLGEAREEELKEFFWKSLIEKGSITARSSGDRASALAVVRKIVSDQRSESTSSASSMIQKEIVGEQEIINPNFTGGVLARMMAKIGFLCRKDLVLFKRANKQNEIRMQNEINLSTEEKMRLKES